MYNFPPNYIYYQNVHDNNYDQVMQPPGDWGDKEEIGADIEPDRKLRAKSDYDYVADGIFVLVLKL